MVLGLEAAGDRDRLGRRIVRRHGDSLRQNRLALHDLNARYKVADESPSLRDGPFLKDLPEGGRVPLISLLVRNSACR